MTRIISGNNVNLCSVSDLLSHQGLGSRTGSGTKRDTRSCIAWVLLGFSSFVLSFSCFWDIVLLCSCGWLGTCYLDQAGLKLIEIHLRSASWVLGLMVYANCGSRYFFYSRPLCNLTLNSRLHGPPPYPTGILILTIYQSTPSHSLCTRLEEEGRHFLISRSALCPSLCTRKSHFHLIKFHFIKPVP